MKIQVDWEDYEFLIKSRTLQEAPKEGLAPEDLCWGNLSAYYAEGLDAYSAVEDIINRSIISEVRARGASRTTLRCRSCGETYAAQCEECPECGSEEIHRRGDEVVLYHGKVDPPEFGIVVRVDQGEYDRFCFVCFDDGKTKPYVLNYHERSLLRRDEYEALKNE